MKSSYLEKNLTEEILDRISGKVKKTMEYLVNDEEIAHLQDYANIVSIKRLKFNDHGPVHMRKVVLNSLKIINLLNNSNIKLNLEKEGHGDFEDSQIAVITSGFLHDLGMSIGRSNHEETGVLLAIPIIKRLLDYIYGDNIRKKVILKSMIIEGIYGHMSTKMIFSKEAGIILVADGCDMAKGRSRIPMLVHKGEANIGDIHQYSSAAIDNVSFNKGKKKPICITIEMSESAGIFQVEDVLIPKIQASTIKKYIELYAIIAEKEKKQYL